MKHGGFKMSKSDYPGLKRVKIDGRMVWMYDGKTFGTKRDVWTYVTNKK